MRSNSTAVLTVVACLVVSVTTVRADDVPSFRKEKDRETKEFVEKVTSVIVKAARSNPQNIEVSKYEYTKPKNGRTDLSVKATWTGLVTKKKYAAEIIVKLDSSDSAKWEVLNIEYKDDNNISMGKPNARKIQDLIKSFNK